MSKPNEFRTSIWIGFHSSLGIVVFDPLAQYDLEQGAVQLWVREGREFKMFQAKVVRSHLQSLKRTLHGFRLSSLDTDFDLFGLIARHYLQNRPRPRFEERAPFPRPDEDSIIGDLDGEYDLILKEALEDQNAWARSDREGWFYDDDD